MVRPPYPQQQTFWTRLGMSQIDPIQTFRVRSANRQEPKSSEYGTWDVAYVLLSFAPGGRCPGNVGLNMLVRAALGFQHNLWQYS